MEQQDKYRIDFKKATLSAVALLGVSACESRADFGRKPEVIASMIDESIATCNVSNESVARERLHDIFRRVRTKKLELLRDNGVTFCLDQRLSRQDTSGLLTRKMLGVYYAGALSGANGRLRSVATLWDNGKPLGEDSIWRYNASEDGSEAVDDLADKIDENGAPKAGENKVAAEYSSSCGRSCTTYYVAWRAGENFTRNMKKNPDLRYAPTKAQW